MKYEEIQKFLDTDRKRDRSGRFAAGAAAGAVAAGVGQHKAYRAQRASEMDGLRARTRAQVARSELHNARDEIRGHLKDAATYQGKSGADILASRREMDSPGHQYIDGDKRLSAIARNVQHEQLSRAYARGAGRTAWESRKEIKTATAQSARSLRNAKLLRVAAGSGRAATIGMGGLAFGLGAHALANHKKGNV